MMTLAEARADALFCAPVPTEPLTRAQAVAAVRHAVRARGVRGCLAAVATEYGDHPEFAAVRMRWAVDTVAQVYPPRKAGVR